MDMELFDKLFNSDSDGPNKEVIQGYIRRFDKKITLPYSKRIGNQKIYDVNIKNPSKAIEANHWDGLTPEAREALSKQGFYRKGDDNIGIITITIEP